MVEHVVEGVLFVLVRRLGQQVDDDLGIAGGLENVPDLLVAPTQQGGVDQVAVVGDRHVPAGEAEQQGLGVGFRA